MVASNSIPGLQLTRDHARLYERTRLVLLPRGPKLFKAGDKVEVCFIVRALVQSGEPTIRGEIVGIREAITDGM